ncbi:hypothetical protein BGX34_009810 [Mortierella sp. NVP85]|nr:hypothetical protein BGX34_009810 [Mortierella sp. NVP85]
MKFVHSSLLLFSVVAVLVQGQSVVVSSKAIFTGVDHSDPNASPIDIYRRRNNHATATASILETISEQAGFQPKEHGLYTTNDPFLAFKTNVKEFELFNPMGSQTLHMRVYGGLEELKKEITGRYFPITRIGREPPSRARLMASALLEQIPSTADQSLSGTWSLAVVALHTEDDNYTRVDISWVDVYIHVNEDGSVAIPPQEALLSEESFEVLSGGFLYNAKSLSEAYPKMDLKTVLDNLTTRQSRGNGTRRLGSGHTCHTESEPPESRRPQGLYRLSQLIMDMDA